MKKNREKKCADEVKPTWREQFAMREETNRNAVRQRSIDLLTEDKSVTDSVPPPGLIDLICGSGC